MKLPLNAGQFFVHQFLSGFCSHLPLLLLCVLLVLLIAGIVGRNLGIHLLIWHEHSLKRVFSGFALTLLFIEIFLVGFLLDSYTRVTPSKGAQRYTNRSNQSMLPQRRWVPPPKFVRQLAAEKPEQPQAKNQINTADVYWYLGNLGAYFSLLLLILVVFTCVWRRNPPFPDMGWNQLRALFFAFGAGVAIVLALVLIRLFVQLSRHPTFLEFEQSVFDICSKLGGPSDRERGGHLAMMCLQGFLLLTLVFYRFDRRARFVTPVVSVCTALGLVAGVYGFVMFWSGQLYPYLATLLIFAIVLVLALGGISRYKVRFRNMGALGDALYNSPVDLQQIAKGIERDPTAAGSAREAKTANTPPRPRLIRNPQQRQVEVNQALEKRTVSCERKVPNDGVKRPVAIVCVSGGASRSAVWTLMVLRQLNRAIPGFSHHVRLITGASGGMVGAAYHVACLQDPGEDLQKQCTFAVNGGQIKEEDMIDKMAGDTISPVMHRLLFFDLPSMILPFALRDDRGNGLEAGWESLLDGALAVPLQQLAAGEEAGWRPSLVFSPMLIEDGRRLLISNQDLDFVALNHWPARNPLKNSKDTSKPAWEFFKFLPECGELRLSTAARMNASFPYFSPAAVLPTKPRRRVVDAGYFDNFGVNLAVNWLYELRGYFKDNASKVALIQVRDGLHENKRNDVSQPQDVSNWLTRGVEWLTSPPEGALGAIWSSMSYRNDEELEFMGDILKREFGDDRFTTVLLENPEPASLNWYVSNGEKKRLQKTLEEPAESDETDTANDSGKRLRKRIEDFARWWNTEEEI